MKKKMKLGKIVIDLGYVVDMNDADMIEESKRCFFEDLMNSIKYNELTGLMSIIKEKGLKESDIPDHIKEIVGHSEKWKGFEDWAKEKV